MFHVLGNARVGEARRVLIRHVVCSFGSARVRGRASSLAHKDTWCHLTPRDTFVRGSHSCGLCSSRACWHALFKTCICIVQDLHLATLPCAPPCKKEDNGQVIRAATVLVFRDFLDTRRSNLCKVHQVRHQRGGQTVSTRGGQTVSKRGGQTVTTRSAP